MENIFEGKKILITGGTGSLGQALTERLLKLNIDTLRILSRNEHKQILMSSKFNDSRLRFLIGDIRDLTRLTKAMEDIDIVFHAAALKHVPIVEYNPFESIKTNVLGSQNVIDASLFQNVERVICVGTDKAVSPLNTYGATKLLMEKLFVTASNHLNPKKHRTKFIALRYGNVLGSSGSVIPLFIEQIKTQKMITITNEEMTRFSITMDEALDFILQSTSEGKGSEIFIPSLRAYSIKDVKETLFQIFGKTDVNHIGIRPGEKMHETLINEDELRNTYEWNKKYVILKLETSDEINKKYNGIKLNPINSVYSSQNVEKIGVDELTKIINSQKILK